MSQIGEVPKNAILVISDPVGIYPSIPHQARLKALKNTLKKREEKHVPVEKLINMVEFGLKNNIFEFNGSVQQQVSGTVICTKCAPTYACIFMYEVEPEFFKTQEKEPLVWFRYIVSWIYWYIFYPYS